MYLRTDDGTKLAGESNIGRTRALSRVWLEPSGARLTPGVNEAIGAADLIVIGPGSLYTSLLAVLMVPGVARAVRDANGRRVFVANLMTQPGSFHRTAGC